MGASSRSKRASRWLVPAALGSVALAAAIVADTRPASVFSTDGQVGITRNAFPFTTGGALGAIAAGDLDEGEGAPRLTWQNTTRRIAGSATAPPTST